MVKEYKNIRIDTETYKALQDKIPTGSFSEKIKKLLGNEEPLYKKYPNKRIVDMTNRAVPKPIVELAVYEACSLLDADVESSARTQILGATKRLLEDLGWDKERKVFFEDRGYRSLLIIAVDNALNSMTRKGWLVKEPVIVDGFAFSIFTNDEESKTAYNYRINWEISKENIKMINQLKGIILKPAKDVIKEEKGSKDFERAYRIWGTKSTKDKPKY